MPDVDGQLFIRFLNNDAQDALEVLFEKYRDGLILFLYGFVQNADVAEELMMDTFAILASGTARYKENKDASFKTWLFAVAKNQALLYLRKRKVKFVSSANDFLNNIEADASFHPVGMLLKNETDSQVYRAMKSIDADYRNALFLLYFENMKPEQISRIIKKSIKQTYNILARGKEALRIAYERMNNSHLAGEG
ncbi:RNA polymerase sigma factor [Fibrobacter sp. UWB12]|uniref:RNA polymerase sigma factor n=1 Tax=Fibrobacter sp. UWB12 TaxID=1896203 RepID=UPI0009149166|nr:RNA polymerase sigma factor [Fibrobacter sp. UWB12]SHK71062.1 RNA polymerase sigma-70 factor, ECF subfamily [Fibrobacter sp. UWB12]